MLLSVIQEQLKSQIMAYNKDFSQVEFEFPQDIKHGHLSSNVAMRYSKIVQKSPRDLANELINSLNLDFIDKIEVAGPGFINFYFKAEVFTNSLKDNYTAVAPAEVIDTVVVDYSAPNIAKPLGIHHVLSTVIGQAVVNLMRAQNHKVIAWNYLGDWGTQFGKLLYAYKQWGNKSVIEQDPISELLKLYVKFHDQAEKNPELEDAGRLEFKKLEQKDPENFALWEWIVELSKKDLAKVYQKLRGIQFDVYSGEADRESELRDIIKDGLAEGVFSLGEKNAIIADLSDQNMVPYIVQKSDGATLYSTRDIASVKHRVEQFGANKLVYVVDTAQNFHFKQLFAVVPKFSWFNPSTKLEHLEFGRMSFADGKMSTRKGNILLLETILDEAVARAKTILLEKNPDFPKDLVDATAEMIGIGSIKYSVLSQAPETNITFDWDKIISFEGNSAPYLQYSCARANSILNQAINIEFTDISTDLDLTESETELILEFLKFEHTVNIAADKLRPNLLANYLYNLARSFNSFYVAHPILNNPDTNQQAVRLSITKSFQSIMKKGLDLLAGIEVPEKM